MDLQLFIAVNIMAFSGLAIAFGAVRRVKNEASLLAVHALVLASGALALVMGWSQPGTLVAGLFIPFIALPGIFAALATRYANLGRNERAARYAKLSVLFHPAPIARFRANLTEALAHDDPGQTVAALHSLGARATPGQKVVLDALTYRAQGRWDDVLAAVQTEPAATAQLRGLDIRALGELGRTDEMVCLYAKHKTHLLGTDLRDVQLFVLAFSGREAAVALMLDTKRAVFDAPTIAYWKGIAALYSGRTGDAARAPLEALAKTAARPLTRAAAQRHLDNASAGTKQGLSADSKIEVDVLEARLLRDAPLRAIGLRHSLATLTLIAANSAMFAVEIWRGGAEDLGSLFALGAMWPPSILTGGEWWRLASALFLHFGWAHFLVNMVSLLALGRIVEAVLGPLRMLAIFLIGGIGSSACVLGLMTARAIDDSVLVGASGAIMALLGALAARQVWNWRASRDVLDRRGLVGLAIIMVLQIGIDLAIPQVSLAAHLSGFAFGFVIASALGAVRASKSD